MRRVLQCQPIDDVESRVSNAVDAVAVEMFRPDSYDDMRGLTVDQMADDPAFAEQFRWALEQKLLQVGIAIAVPKETTRWTLAQIKLALSVVDTPTIVKATPKASSFKK